MSQPVPLVAFMVWLLLRSFAAASDGASGAKDGAGAVRWEAWSVTTRDGTRLEGRLGRLRVPERHADPDGPTIELAFVVLPSTNPEPGPPIVVLAGGPGASGVEYCVEPATDPRVDLLRYGDVIGLDQRGTGRCAPSLEDAPDFSWRLPFDRAITREDVIEADRASIGGLVAYWTERGVDLAAYNTVESADDVDAVRAALGLERVVLWGESYGSHLGLAVLRRHAAHVARAVLCKVEGPDQTWKLPSTLQAQLERAGALAAADAAVGPVVPDLVGAVRGLLELLREEPAHVRLPDGGEVVAGPYDLQRALTRLFAHHQLVGMLPAFVDALTRGDWTRLGQAAAQHREGGDVSAMTLMMDCSSWASPERLARIERERRDPANLLGDAMDGVYPAICTACGSPDLGEAFRAPFRCDVPTLFVSGELDARTPPENVDALADGFTHHAHVVATNTGHEARELQSDAFRTLLAAFLGGEEVESTTVELPPPPFRPIEPAR